MTVYTYTNIISTAALPSDVAAEIASNLSFFEARRYTPANGEGFTAVYLPVEGRAAIIANDGLAQWGDAESIDDAVECYTADSEAWERRN